MKGQGPFPPLDCGQLAFEVSLIRLPSCQLFGEKAGLFSRSDFGVEMAKQKNQTAPIFVLNGSPAAVKYANSLEQAGKCYKEQREVMALCIAGHDPRREAKTDRG